MAVMRIMPIRELGERQHRAALFFGAEAATFLDLEGKFAALLSSDALGEAKGWFRKARLWRMVFLQDKEGFFEPTDSLAFALLAVLPNQIPHREYKGIKKLIQRFQRAEDDGNLQGGLKEGREEEDLYGGEGPPRDGSGRTSLRASSRFGGPAQGVGLRRGHTLLLEHATWDSEFDASLLKDCPLSYSADAIYRSVPRALKLVNELPKPLPKVRRLQAFPAAATKTTQSRAAGSRAASAFANGGRLGSAAGPSRATAAPSPAPSAQSSLRSPTPLAGAASPPPRMTRRSSLPLLGGGFPMRADSALDAPMPPMPAKGADLPTAAAIAGSQRRRSLSSLDNPETAGKERGGLFAMFRRRRRGSDPFSGGWDGARGGFSDEEAPRQPPSPPDHHQGQLSASAVRSPFSPTDSAQFTAGRRGPPSRAPSVADSAVIFRGHAHRNDDEEKGGPSLAMVALPGRRGSSHSLQLPPGGPLSHNGHNTSRTPSRTVQFSDDPPPEFRGGPSRGPTMNSISSLNPRKGGSSAADATPPGYRRAWNGSLVPLPAGPLVNDSARFGSMPTQRSMPRQGDSWGLDAGRGATIREDSGEIVPHSDRAPPGLLSFHRADNGAMLVGRGPMPQSRPQSRGGASVHGSELSSGGRSAGSASRPSTAMGAATSAAAAAHLGGSFSLRPDGGSRVVIGPAAVGSGGSRGSGGSPGPGSVHSGAEGSTHSSLGLGPHGLRPISTRSVSLNQITFVRRNGDVVQEPRSPGGTIGEKLTELGNRPEDQEINVLRVWSTCLALASCESFDFTWLVDADNGVTIVDQARIWLDRLADDDPRLKKILPDVMRRARALVKLWNTAMLDRLNVLRDKECEVNRLGLDAQMGLEASGTIIKALKENHSTFSIITSDCLNGLTRWQRWMILLSLVLSTLLVTIWFYSSRAQNCCLEVRALPAGCRPPAAAVASARSLALIADNVSRLPPPPRRSARCSTATRPRRPPAAGTRATAGSWPSSSTTSRTRAWTTTSATSSRTTCAVLFAQREALRTGALACLVPPT